MSQTVLSLRIRSIGLACTTLIAILAILFAFGFRTVSQQPSGQPVPVSVEYSLGDVKYSVLDPDKFELQNGKGWVLMRGQDISDSDLFRLTGMKTLPDARGVFIRGMNLDQANSKGDPEGNRNLGSFQMDAFQGHGHIHEIEDPGEEKNPAGTFKGVNGSGSYMAGRVLAPTALANYGSPRFDVETRPRNITLFTYIKIYR